MVLQIQFRNNSATEWGRRYTNYLAIGKTVEEAVEYANGWTYGDPKVKKNIIMGDKNLRIQLTSDTGNSTVQEDNSQKNKLYASETQKIYEFYGDDKNFDFNNPCYVNISNYIEHNIDINFDLNNFTIYLSNPTGQNGTIDFIYTINGFETSLSYVAYVENGVFTKIIENGDIANYNSIVNYSTLGNIPPISEDMHVIAKAKAIEPFVSYDLNSIYELISQQSKVVLDIQTNDVYILVFSDYQDIETNTFFGNEFMYKIPDQSQVSVTLPDLSYNGVFSYNTVRILTENYHFNTVFVEISKYDTPNATPIKVSKIVNIDALGVGIYSPVSSSVQMNAPDSYIEIAVYKDNSRQQLLTRHIVKPVLFEF